MLRSTDAVVDYGELVFHVLLDDSVWCTVCIMEYNRVPPNPNSWDSPEDYGGHTNIVWYYDCPRDLTDQEIVEVEQEAIEQVERMKEKYREESRINSWEIMKMQYEYRKFLI